MNPLFVDVEHEFSGYIEDPDGESHFGSAWPDTLRIYDRSEWRDRARELENAGFAATNYLRPYNNQHPESSCVYNAAEVCLRYIRNRTLGNKYEMKLSPMSGYCRVTTRRHSGSTMWGALGQVSEIGLLPERSSEYTSTELKALHRRSVTMCRHTFHQNTPFMQARYLPEGFEQTARHFRVLEWIRIDNEEQFASALLAPYPICYGRNGHSIAAVQLDFNGREPFAKYLDSYGASKGEGGFLWDSRRRWNTGGAWAARAVTIPDDPRLPCGSDGLTQVIKPDLWM